MGKGFIVNLSIKNCSIFMLMENIKKSSFNFQKTNIIINDINNIVQIKNPGGHNNNNNNTIDS